MQGVALANPEGGVVVGGAASIAAQGNTTTITQTSDRAAINWNSFDIKAGETTEFKQPNQNSVALNRVVGSEQKASQIAGNLNANGKVILINPNGILFDKTAKVDVAGLVASTANMRDADFMAGSGALNEASSNKSARVVNKGTITLKESGLGVLVAPDVANEGTITAKLGRVALGGAETATIDFYGNGMVQFAVQDEALAVNEQLNWTPAFAGDSLSVTTTPVESPAKAGVQQNNGTARGGFVEISGKGYLDMQGEVDLTSQYDPSLNPNPQTLNPSAYAKGTLLLDPADIVISNFAPNDASVSANLKLWLDASDASTVTLSYSTDGLGTTADATAGTNTITTGADVSANLAVGARIRLTNAGTDATADTLGTDTYTIAAISGTTITTVETIAAGGYSGQTLFRGLVSQWNDKSGQTVPNNPTLSRVLYNAQGNFLQVFENGGILFNGSDITTGIIYSLQQKIAGKDVDGRVLAGSAGNALFGNWATNGNAIHIGNPSQYASGIANAAENLNLKLYALEYPTSTSVNFYAEGALLLSDTGVNSIAGITWATNSYG